MIPTQSIESAKELLSSIKADTDLIKKAPKSQYFIKMSSGERLLVKEKFSELNLSENIIKAIYKIGYEKPSLIQSSSIPLILNGGDLAVQSESGTGKTVAFVAPLLDCVKKGSVQGIVLAPTKELCTQIGNIVNELGKDMEIRGLVVTSKESRDEISLAAKSSLQGYEIVIGTPGSIINMVRQEIFDPKSIKMLVVDEADACIDNHSAHSTRILRSVSGQKIFFSATYSELIKKMIKHVAPNVEEIYAENTKPAEIKLFYIDVKKEKKTETLMLLCEYLSIGQMIVFVATRKRAEILKKELEDDMHKVGCIHGEMDVDAREKAVSDFRSAATKVLVSTDVFSRGMDIPQVNLIVNYDMPVYQNKVLSENYIHRIGRSGRFGRTGFIIDFISSKEDYNAIIEMQDKLKCPSKKFSMDDLKKAFYEIDE
ncbi:RNA helicase required for poly(A+) mRNA export [Gurleya vavrai]